MDYDADYQYVFISPNSFGSLLDPMANTLAALRAGNPMPVVTYNTLVAAVAVMRDIVSKGKAPPVGTYGVVETTYHGSFKDMQGKPVVVIGDLPPPSDKDARLWYDALSEVFDTLESKRVLNDSPAGVSFAVDVGDLVGLADDAADAALDPRYTPPGYIVSVPAETGAKIAQVIVGAGSFANHLVLAAEGASPASTEEGARMYAAITAATPTATAFQKDRQTRSMYLMGGAGVAVLGGILAVATAKPVRRAARRTTRRATRYVRRLRADVSEATTTFRQARSRRRAQSHYERGRDAQLKQLYRERMDIIRAIGALKDAEQREPGGQHTRSLAAARQERSKINAKIAELKSAQRASRAA